MPLSRVTITRRRFAGGLLAVPLAARIAAAQAAPATLLRGPTHLEILDSQNLRADLGPEARVLAVLPPGTVVTVFAGPRFLDGYTWYGVVTPYGRGWLAAD